MNQFEFFKSKDLAKVKTAVNAWIERRQTADGKTIDIISWDFQNVAGLYIMTLFYSETATAEKVGFQNQKKQQ